MSQLARSARSYEILAELNVKSAVNYLAKANHHMKAVEHHGDKHSAGPATEHHEPSETNHEGGH